MIEKFAAVRGLVGSEFLDLNHTSESVILVSLMISKFAREAGGKVKANFGIAPLGAGMVEIRYLWRFCPGFALMCRLPPAGVPGGWRQDDSVIGGQRL